MNNQNIGPGHFKNNRNRFDRDMDSFNGPNNDFDSAQNDLEEFRPMQIIDYQNRGQNQAPIGNQPAFGGNFPPKPIQIIDHFPRKITDYDHVSKVHPWNWYCPIIQIEYNHTKDGCSLHKNPPPKVVDKKSQMQQPNRMRQANWPHGSVDRKERNPHAGPAPNQQNVQSRSENWPNFPPQPTKENQRNNAAGKNWIRNVKEWGNSSQNIRNNDR